MDDAGLCALCREGAAGFDAAYSFGAYEGALRDLIHLFKYAKIRTLDRPLASKLIAAFPRDERFDAIVPVPIHWLRRWKRGFNQTELLAHIVSARTGIPVRHALMRRGGGLTGGPAQAGLTSAQRRENTDRAFEAKRKADLSGRRILLIDDVFTTGATAGACARALKRAGATSVALLTLARVDRRLADSSAGQGISGAS